MAQFTVRVELHDAAWADYDRLHIAMERKGFSRLITAYDGRKYHLPLAEYDASGNVTSTRVLEIAREAADSTGKQNAVLVTEASNRVWSGLEQA